MAQRLSRTPLQWIGLAWILGIWAACAYYSVKTLNEHPEPNDPTPMWHALAWYAALYSIPLGCLGAIYVFFSRASRLGWGGYFGYVVLGVTSVLLQAALTKSGQDAGWSFVILLGILWVGSSIASIIAAMTNG